MPFHHAPFRAAALSARICLLRPPPTAQWHYTPLLHNHGFHASRPLRDDATLDDGKNHYETLNVPTDASHAEIKKSFYTLSKTHHPDHNPHDPHSPRRFMRISEAYHILGRADARARYDRDVLRLSAAHKHHAAARRSGSYSSTGPAGGRPASGLSRRRGTFTGPPPSFYRSGGWGSHGAKRRASHEETTGTGGQGRGGMGEGGGGAGTGPGAGAGAAAGAQGGMGPGQDPSHGTAGAGHFDHVGHERMHRRRDESSRARRRAEDDVPPVDTGLWFRFVVVSGLVAGVVYVPYWFSKGGSTQGKKRDSG